MTLQYNNYNSKSTTELMNELKASIVQQYTELGDYIKDIQYKNRQAQATKRLDTSISFPILLESFVLIQQNVEKIKDQIFNLDIAISSNIVAEEVKELERFHSNHVNQQDRLVTEDLQTGYSSNDE